MRDRGKRPESCSAAAAGRSRLTSDPGSCGCRRDRSDCGIHRAHRECVEQIFERSERARECGIASGALPGRELEPTAAADAGANVEASAPSRLHRPKGKRARGSGCDPVIRHQLCSGAVASSEPIFTTPSRRVNGSDSPQLRLDRVHAPRRGAICRARARVLDRLRRLRASRLTFLSLSRDSRRFRPATIPSGACRQRPTDFGLWLLTASRSTPGRTEHRRSSATRFRSRAMDCRVAHPGMAQQFMASTSR